MRCASPPERDLNFGLTPNIPNLHSSKVQTIVYFFDYFSCDTLCLSDKCLSNLETKLSDQKYPYHNSEIFFVDFEEHFFSSIGNLQTGQFISSINSFAQRLIVVEPLSSCWFFMKWRFLRNQSYNRELLLNLWSL
jgi:hypothetical protein